MKDWNDERKPLNREKIHKGLSHGLEKKLNKTYPSHTSIDDKFRGNDITFVTNENGEPVSLFIGKRRPDGTIKGERFSRKIKRREGNVIKESHWDNQGKV